MAVQAQRECRNIYFTPLVHSMYALHLRRWMQTYPIDSMLLLRFDEIVLRPVDVLQRVASFLSIVELAFDGGATAGAVAARVGVEAPRVPRAPARLTWRGRGARP